MVVAFFAQPDSLPDKLSDEFLVWASIIGGFSLLLGAVSITRVNAKMVAARRPGWVYSLVTLICVFVM